MKYPPLMILIHWLMVIVLTLVFCMGVFVNNLDFSPLKIALINYHKWLGIIALILVMLRIAIRVFYWKLIPTPLPAPKIQILMAHLIHLMLYLCMLAVPLFGWLSSSSGGFPVVLFGLIPLPNLIHEDYALSEIFEEFHVFFAYLGLFCLILHVLGALKHVLIDKDETMSRMTRFK